MTESTDARLLVAELEREERAARAAEAARRTIRLGYGHVIATAGHEEQPPKRWFHFLSGRVARAVEREMDEAQVSAVYDALGIVRSNHETRANALAKQLNTEAKF